MIGNEDVQKLADLARISLSEKEAESLKIDITGVLKYIDQIKKAPTKDRKKATSGFGLINVFREDEVVNKGGEYSEVLLKSAPKSADSRIKVKKIIS